MKRFNVRLKSGLVVLPEEDIAVLFHSGAIARDTRCSELGKAAWSTIDELFPLLKYGAARTAAPVSRGLFDGMSEPRTRQQAAQNSSMVAGWTCFGIGAAISWIFPPGYVIFSVAVVMAVVAMATNQVSRGLILLLSSFLGMGVSALISFLLAVGLFTAAAGYAISRAEVESQRQNAVLARQMEQVSQASQRLIQTLPSQAAAPLAVKLPDGATRLFNQNFQSVTRSAPRAVTRATPAPTATPNYNLSTEAQLRRLAEQKQKRDSYKTRSEDIRRMIDFWQKMGRDSQGSGREFAEKQADSMQKQLQKLNSENLGM